MEDRASPFAARTVAVLIGLGLLFGAAFLLTVGFGNDIGERFGRPPPARSHAGDGLYGLYALVDALPGRHARFADRAEDVATAGLLVLPLEAETVREDLDAMMAQRRSAGRATLIVLPKWQTRPVSFGSERVAIVGMVDPAGFLPALGRDDWKIFRMPPAKAAAAPDYTGDAPPPFRRAVQALSGPGLTPLITVRDKAVLAQIGDRNTYILTDPDLVNNHALRDRRGAAAALSMLNAIAPSSASAILFDTTLHFRPGERNLVRLMFVPPFLAVTLALIAAGLLTLVASFARFGPASAAPRGIAFGKRALLDNIAALSRLARKTHRAGGHYADAVAERTARRLHAPRGLSPDELRGFLDARTPNGPRFSELAARAKAARSEAEMLYACRAIDDWRREITA
ncbi:hypothetical protein [Stakelama saccharophila]|uniref:DUF4350 domain-containing protein n=1 Tax=Stakelama saccharophila TaxID=3075605 RepID=A0ABZ0BBP9_9SPHN|nr:hypothetical protein [Stakelama sp. W311]WNO54778.1 hypothetical protein RPR59_05905 [Stakelama sp. W311]